MMQKSALITKKIIKLNDVRKESRKRPYEKSVPFETKFLTNHAMEEMCNPYCQGLSVSRSRGKTYIRK